MNITQSLFHKFRFNNPVVYLIVIFLAILNGLSDVELFHQVGFFLSDLFIQIFKCVSLPIISLSLIVTLINYSSDKLMKNIWRRTIRYTFTTTIIAATISCLLYIFIQPAMVSGSTGHYTAKAHQQGYLAHLANIVPSNVFAPFIEHEVMSVLLVSLVFGFAIRQIPDKESRRILIQFFRGAHGLFLVITRWVVAVIPLGLFGFITTTMVQLRSGMVFKGLGEYLLIIVLANLIQGLVVLPIWLKMKGVKPFPAFMGMMPALSLAFFSKSSVGSLPVTMNTIEKNLKVKPEISRFVLPLCTSINMNGCAAFIFVTVIYLMQNQGIHISLPMMALWVLVSTIAAIGNAGVPMGCFFLSASLLVSMNVPITLMGIILPFYSLIDMLETALNVWSDVCVTKVVNNTADAEELLPAVTGTSYPVS
ncbi:dicarboxylate/amino acid:cation symporter [Legionella israelensis]|uniref:Amino acid transporter n=1 Tax=Legionella israelensis TaxID=454 RepID=A0A0W0WE05_9GAMM|nr:dicarboxylate/amino acid:cation symporter [Legionella israelensis]KTD30609.1 amino acid transporter [Legionella israelensis]QBR83891.1 dicarboxylate/amino acid:cation symporter [Legionella israelensis]QBS10772.1 dicarboxylate/amino acid:cation symporter [Legionella israelensis]SCY32356.1 Na+/H+-dicarboxylate symporter [Legionella israelensis DSM 19235]STX57744.1 amino acid transporter [Legionella israelensis]